VEEAIDAVEWKEPAPDGGSQAQIFRLADDRIAVVKFAENPQGPRVLFNEFVSCRLAETLELPINRAVMVRVEASTLTIPKRDKCPAAFNAGIHCGLIRYPDAAKTDPANDLFKRTKNTAELHSVLVFEQLVARSDSRQLLVYPATAPEQSFAAYDYGHAFGGTPAWTEAAVKALPPPPLPGMDAVGGTYTTGDHQRTIIDRLRRMQDEEVEAVIGALGLPRWGVTVEEGRVIAAVVLERARALVKAYDEKYPPKATGKPGDDAARVGGAS